MRRKFTDNRTLATEAKTQVVVVYDGAVFLPSKLKSIKSGAGCDRKGEVFITGASDGG